MYWTTYCKKWELSWYLNKKTIALLIFSKYLATAENSTILCREVKERLLSLEKANDTSISDCMLLSCHVRVSEWIHNL